MKVAHIVGKLKAAGVESVVFTYLRFMDRSGMEIDVLYDADSMVEPPRDLEEAGIRFIKIPPYQKLPEYMKTLRRLFREEKYDIVHSHINSLSVFPLRAAKSAGVKHRISHNHTTSSKAELARRMKIPRANVSRIENGQNVTFETFARYLRGCGFDFSLKIFPLSDKAATSAGSLMFA